MLRRGELVALPTETVYGLAADAANGEAVARIFAAKGRPRFNPLICHVTDLAMARRYGAARRAGRAAGGNILAGAADARRAACGRMRRCIRSPRPGLPTIALRAPAHPAHDVIAAFGGALAAPSRQPLRPAQPDARGACHRAARRRRRRWSSMAGRARSGWNRPSSRSPATRPQAAPAGRRAGGGDRGRARRRSWTAPCAGDRGRRAGHARQPLRAAPAAAARCERRSRRARRCSPSADARSTAPSARSPMRNLSPSGDLVEAAANLFAISPSSTRAARAASRSRRSREHGLGEAINDRLARGAAGR